MIKHFSWSQRLYVRIYAAVMASLAAAALLFYLLLNFYPDLVGNQQIVNFDSIADFASEILPSPSASTETVETALHHRRWRRYVGLALYTQDGQRIAATGIMLPPPDPAQNANGWLGGHPPVFAVRLADGRWLVGQRIPQAQTNRAPRINVQMWLGLLALALAIGAYPVVRRMTGRLERLQKSVVALGEGQLSTRVAIEGDDEVARLAESFNKSATRIEALVASQKTLLANASHELRSPLTRIRMALELMDEGQGAALREELIRNIGELDQLVDEILLASRLESMGDLLPRKESVDLTGLLAEECARVDAQLDGPNATVVGDSKLLRRMLRNLLENAKRYGDSSPVTAHINTSQPGVVVVDICDGGRGVPEAEREKIFEPFYRLAGARERDGGVGLGLSLVRQIARGHRGDVECLPRSERGSCFRVTIAN